MIIQSEVVSYLYTSYTFIYSISDTTVKLKYSMTAALFSACTHQIRGKREKRQDKRSQNMWELRMRSSWQKEPEGQGKQTEFNNVQQGRKDSEQWIAILPFFFSLSLSLYVCLLKHFYTPTFYPSLPPQRGKQGERGRERDVVSSNSSLFFNVDQGPRPPSVQAAWLLYILPGTQAIHFRMSYVLR